MKKVLLTWVALMMFSTLGCSSGDADKEEEPIGYTEVEEDVLMMFACADSGCSHYRLIKYSLESDSVEFIPNIEDPAELHALDGKLYFSTEIVDSGQELWVYDPALEVSEGANPKLLVDLRTGVDSSYPKFLETLNGKLYFQAVGNASVVALHVYDPELEVSSTNPRQVGGDTSAANLEALDGKLYFKGVQTASGDELWVYDPEVAEGATNPQIVYNVSVGSGNHTPQQLTAFSGKLYYSAGGIGEGRELWVYDPALPADASNPSSVADINPVGSASGNPLELTVLNGVLYFTANDGLSGIELWTYDPTLAVSGTNPGLLYDINAGVTNASPESLRVHEGKLYFSAGGAGTGRELYVYDPAEAVSGLNPELFELNAGAQDTEPHSITSFKGRLFSGYYDGSGYSFGEITPGEALVLGANPINITEELYSDWAYQVTPLTFTRRVAN